MITSVGEILVDMIAEENNGSVSYLRKAGGAPFNVACGIKLLGGNVGFVGSVGNDTIGDFLLRFAGKQKLDYYEIRKDTNRNTTLAFVDLDESGERSFCFYRKNTADIYLPEISDELIENSAIMHIGSLMLSKKEGLEYALRLIERVHKKGKLISFDVNFRTDIFPSKNDAILVYKQVINKADIVKFSSDEVEIFGEEYVDSLKDKLICITLGSDGSEYIYNDIKGKIPTIKVKPVDTTGAGDAFYAGVLTKIDNLSKCQYTKKVLNEAFRFGNICGALNTLGKGAIDNFPSIEVVNSKISMLEEA